MQSFEQIMQITFACFNKNDYLCTALFTAPCDIGGAGTIKFYTLKSLQLWQSMFAMYAGMSMTPK